MMIGASAGVLWIPYRPRRSTSAVSKDKIRETASSRLSPPRHFRFFGFRNRLSPSDAMKSAGRDREMIASSSSSQRKSRCAVAYPAPKISHVADEVRSRLMGTKPSRSAKPVTISITASITYSN